MRVSRIAFAIGATCMAAGLGGCAGMGVTAPAVTPAMVATSGAPAATLNAGRELFATRCTACHNAEPVSSRSADGWRRVVDQMSNRAKLQAGERSALLAYLAAAQSSGSAPTAR